MKEKLSGSFNLEYYEEGVVIFQLGCDQTGKIYFLHVDGMDFLLDKQIGFNARLDYKNDKGSKIVLQKYIERPEVGRIVDHVREVEVKILGSKNPDDVVLNLGKYDQTLLSLECLDEDYMSMYVLTYVFKNTDNILPPEDEVNKFLDGITWHK